MKAQGKQLLDLDAQKLRDALCAAPEVDRYTALIKMELIGRFIPRMFLIFMNYYEYELYGIPSDQENPYRPIPKHWLARKTKGERGIVLPFRKTPNR